MSTARLLRSKLSKRRVWRRIFLERLTEPLHLNVISVGVLLFGSYRARIDWDLVVRPHYAYSILKAADIARAHGVRRVTLAEFGVASGAGLMNMASIAENVSAATGVEFSIHGFDTGAGMPPGIDYRDHPDLYQQGDFDMDVSALREILPSNVELHLGPIKETVPDFLAQAHTNGPIGFIALDVDYYSSSVDALEVLRASDATSYLPLVVIYVDDINLDEHNTACGELLAIREFNQMVPQRPLEHHPFLEKARIFRRPAWLKQIYFGHVLDHPARSRVTSEAVKRYIENPHLTAEQQRERFYLSETAHRG